jgi:hypothetical protein
MLSAKCVRGCLTLFIAFGTPACGSQSPSSPTGVYSQTTQIVQSTGFGGAVEACQEFNNSRAGAVTVFVTPPSIHLVLRVGTCNAPGQIVAEKDTELVNVNAPAGSNHVRLTNPNPGGPDTPYMLRLTYWR